MKLKHFLLTALILFCGVGGVYAGKRFVGFNTGGGYTNTQLQKALDEARPTGDTVFVAAGLYVATDSAFLVPANVTLIGGYAKEDNTDNLTRRYPGQFVPFTTSDLSANTQFTILDGNSYKRTLPAQKHRVVTVKTGGVVDGCLIRNGHVRNSNGGGVLLDGGKLYNSIVRGNVAMSHPDSAEALGGGVFVQGGGELINCLVAYNMANDGYGVAAGTGGGRMINNTITANTYAPVFSKIPGTNSETFKMYKGNITTNYRPGATITKMTAAIKLTDFYLSRTLTTEGQYAVFCAAMDIIKASSFGNLNMTILNGLREPVLNGGTVGSYYYASGPIGNEQNILQANTNPNQPGLNYANGVWYPTGDTATVEYPMGNVTWYGSLAYSVWLGGGLPTEGQWEFAARRVPGGTGTNIVNENLYSGAYGATTDNPEIDTWRVLDTIAWVHVSKSIDTTATHFGQMPAPWEDRGHEVARKRPNAMGIYDMTGLMHEHIADFFKGPADSEIYTNNATNPIQNTAYDNNYRSIRGGSWNHTTRAAFFLGNREPIGYDGMTIVGFRTIVAF